MTDRKYGTLTENPMAAASARCARDAQSPRRSARPSSNPGAIHASQAVGSRFTT